MPLKDLLLRQTVDAFSRRKDMSLMGALEGITDEEANWRADPKMPTAEQIVRHVAWAKSWYCFEGFGKPMVIADPSVDANGDHADLPWEFPCGAAWGRGIAPGIRGAIELLEKAQGVLLECLQSCTEESLSHPIPTRHGESSAANFFWIMAMHDTYHAGQIRTRRSTLRPRW
jgi:hypothetical protein